MDEIRKHRQRFTRLALVFAGLCFCYLLIPFGLNAQQVLLSHNVLEDTVAHHYGQNLRHYVHAYGGLGIMAGASSKAGAEMVYVMSPNVEAGLRYKLKVARHYSVGCDLSYNLYSYKIKQNEEKILPDSLQHKAERFLFSNLSLGIFNRINLGRTGNYIGKFIDVGVYGDWVHYADYYTRDNLENGNTVRTHTSNLDYIRNIQYGLYARFGITRYGFSVKYRLSDYFTSNRAFPELPRWTFGFQVGIHKVN
jgi:hypothetical protein